MKIDSNSLPLPSSQIGEATSRSSNPKTSAGSNSGGAVDQGSSVNLSAASANLRTIENGVSNTPAVNTAKIAEIKQAITEGRFQVNSGAVADSLISSVKEMLNTAQQ